MADKTLGQHWLFDTAVLRQIAAQAVHIDAPIIVEIGPGLGTLTAELANTGKHVIAIEYDARLIDGLRAKFQNTQVEIIEADVRLFDFSTISNAYTIAANIPYYLTSHLLQLLVESSHRPQRAVLLVQKEVAERLAARPGSLSILGVSIQLAANVTQGDVVPARLFSPPPKVDSQIVVLEFFQTPQYDQPKQIMRIVKAGFSAPRKKLRSSLSGGLGVGKDQAEAWLAAAGIDANRRAETVSVEEWARLTQIIT